MKKVGIRKKQTEIIGGNKKFERILSTVAMGAFLADICTWCVLPFIVRYIAYFREEETLEDEEVVEEHFEYFCLIMWLPERATEFPIYEILHVLQFFSVWGVVANYAAGKLITVPLFYHLSNHFLILSTAIQDIDILCHADQTKEEDRLLEVMSVNPRAQDTDISSASINPNYVREGDSVIKLSVMQTRNNGDLVDTSSANNTKIFVTEFMLVTTPEDCDNEVAYLTHCIRYHQELLK